MIEAAVDKGEGIAGRSCLYKTFFLNHNLEYGDTKSGQLEDWLVKKIFLYACNQKSLKRTFC